MVLNHSEGKPQPDLRACKPYARSIKHSFAHAFFQPVKCALPQLSGIPHSLQPQHRLPHLYDRERPVPIRRRKELTHLTV